METFGSYVTALMRRQGVTVTSLSERLGYQGTGSVGGVRVDAVPIPADRVIDWADALRLEGDDRREFILRAHIARLPDWLQQRIVETDRRLTALEELAARCETAGTKHRKLVDWVKKQGLQVPEALQ